MIQLINSYFGPLLAHGEGRRRLVEMAWLICQYFDSKASLLVV